MMDADEERGKNVQRRAMYLAHSMMTNIDSGHQRSVEFSMR